MDLLIKSDNRYLGIDLVGYPGEMASEFKLEGYIILKRAEFNDYLTPYFYWKEQKKIIQFF